MSGDVTSADATPAPYRSPRHGAMPDLSLSGQPTAADPVAHRDRGAATPSIVLQPGMLVGRDARYELLVKIGAGGMGEVWKARDVELGREVAIKRILGDASPALRMRFQRETQAATNLRHPNIVTVFDAGEDAFGLYLVMEFVPGQTLAQLLHKGSLPPRTAVNTMVGLCRGAAHAHKRGAVHRDIKPSNIMLDDDGTPRLIDFGLVRMDGASDLSLTSSGMGTFDYAAPEQKQDASLADARSDVYALGVVFYEMLTGLRPPVTPKRVPDAWRDLIERAADGVAADRHANAAELLAEIETLLASGASHGDPGQVLGGADDLRCPSCKLLNALEAKLCRKCGTSLRGPCPACSGTIRLGLQRCDQCFANVGYVAQLRSGIDAVRDFLRDGLLNDARARVDDLRTVAESGHLGPASSLLPAWAEQVAELELRTGQYSSETRDADAALLRHDFGLADRHWRRAAALDRGDESSERAWQARVAAAKQAQDEELHAVAAECSRLAADVKAGKLHAAEQGLAKLLAGFEATRRQWHGDSVQKVGELRQEVLRKREKALRLVREADAKLARWEDEKAIVDLQAAVAHDDVHARKLTAAITAGPDRMARRACALAALLERMQSIRVHVEARDLLAAQAEMAALGKDDWSRFAPAWFSSSEPMRIRGDGELVISALAKDFAAAERLVADAETQLAEREDEAAIWLLQRAAELRPEIASMLSAVRAASGARIAARDAARAEYLKSVEGMRGALDARWLGQVKSWGRRLESHSEDVGSVWWALQAEDVAELRSQERQLGAAFKAQAMRRRLLVGSWVGLAVLVVGGWVGVNAHLAFDASSTERKRIADAKAVKERLAAESRERERMQEADERGRRELAAKTAHAAEFQLVADALAKGDTKYLLAFRRLAKKLPLDSRVIALRPRAEELAANLLTQCLDTLGARFQRNDPSALIEWNKLTAWFGDDVRLEPLRRRAALAQDAARPSRLRRAGLVAAAGAEIDPATDSPRKVLHIATGYVLVLIPAGEFLMGSPVSEPQRDGDEAQHRREIEKPFYLGATEVTQAQWRKVMAGNPSRLFGGNLPVDSVTWNDCQSFLQAVGDGMRLPSEAEWEFACRAGATTPFSFGATITADQVNCDGQVPYGGVTVGRYRASTVPAGALPPNAWGLHEMHGNVWEWCQDGYGDYPLDGTGDPAPASLVRVARGGSWDSSAKYCRSACRGGFESGFRFNRLGLRLARAVPE